MLQAANNQACGLLVGFTLAEETAQEIIDKSTAAMAAPIRFRLITNGVESVVYQKKMSNNVLAMRMETPKPINVVRIVVGAESYEVYADKGIVIDTSFMQQSVLQQVAGISQSLGDAAVMGTFVLKGIVEFNGKRCFELVKTVPSDVVAMLLKQVPENAKGMIPVESRQYIDSESYVLVGLEGYSSSGERVTQSLYADITKPSALQNDLFLPPNGSKVLKPTSMPAYVASVLDVTQPKLSESQPLGPIKIDPKTGLAIAPVPPGMTEEDFKRRVSKAKAKALIEMGSRPVQVTSWTRTRMIFAGMFLTILVVVAGIAIWKKRPI
jgi:hypothetical protein